MNRLEVAKQVFLEFVQGNKGALKGRPNDLIGLITFAYIGRKLAAAHSDSHRRSRWRLRSGSSWST